MASTVWRGYITFGLISIPVRLFRAARAERVSLRKVYRAGPPVREASREDEEEVPEPGSRPFTAAAFAAEEPVSRVSAAVEPVKVESGVREPNVLDDVQEAQPAATWQPIRQVAASRTDEQVLSQRAVAKGYEYEKNRFVALDAEELKSIAPKTATEMQIEEFVRLAEVDPVYFETSYYVVPEDAGKKAYALLYRALESTELVAVAQFAMHGREHVVIVRPGRRGLVAHTMFFANEVRADEEFRADGADVTTKELKLAETLIQALAASFEPSKYRDTYREKLEELIAKKVEGQPIATPDVVVRANSVIDITEALQKSLAALKKPAGDQARPVKRKTAKQAS